MKQNLIELSKGLDTDSSKLTQTKGSYSFALNTVNESELGDFGFRGNEESNRVISNNFPVNHIPIGKAYIGDNSHAMLLVSSDGETSNIGILKENGDYETHVSTDVLKFRVDKQIDAIYRLRRGCERTIYWTDDNRKPRYFNFDSPEDFKDNLGEWDERKFNLFTTYDTIPVFQNISVVTGGQLPPGSYNAAIQYLDNDLNPTEWIDTTETVIIYNDAYSKDFKEIRGSTTEVTEFREFPTTNKAISFDLGNLDTEFSFYRIAIIESNTGSGEISRVVTSNEISTRVNTYLYTGDAQNIIPVEEILQFNNIIERAKSINQLENRLLLSNTQGKQIDFCRLQKYASRITADLSLREITLDNINVPNNQKRGEVHTEDIGYMPGEIYSFGIVYVFRDGTKSPVYHIPGRAEGQDSRMSLDNQCQDARYIDNNSSCNRANGGYWGIDSKGNNLLNENIRHHRFPKRSEIEEPLYRQDVITKESSTTVTTPASGDLHIRFSMPTNPLLTGTHHVRIFVNTLDPATCDIPLVVDFTPLGTTGVVEVFIASDNAIIDSSNPCYTGNFVGQSTAETIQQLGISDLIISTSFPVTSANKIDFTDLTYELFRDVDASSTTTTTTVTELSEDVILSNIMGITFSNIELPTQEDLPEGDEVVGYYIVRNERRESDRTILDYGLMHPTLQESNYTAIGPLNPSGTLSKESNEVFGLIHPENKFLEKDYSFASGISLEGQYNVSGGYTTQQVIQDVQPGTSYDAEVSARRERDSDGFSLHTASRESSLTHDIVDNVELELNNISYLDALSSTNKTLSNSNLTNVFNVSSDNKTGVVQLDSSVGLPRHPYVCIERDLLNPYQNFRVLPYYKDSKNFENGDSVTIFNGDSYITPMRYTNTYFYDIRLRNRGTKDGTWNIVLGVLATIAGIALTATGIGASAGLMLAGLGVSQIAAGIRKENIAKVYQEEYELGLRDAVDDSFSTSVFGPNPSDDEIQWISDHLSTVWIETSINTNWRMGATIGIPDFLDAIETNSNPSSLNTYIREKLTETDSESNSGRLYKGFANAEIYDINLDYLRRNREKIYFHLGLEFDCCSECMEDFPHRIAYSEQSFQEELTDNFRNFLPNNYRDINGETGEITDVFTLSNTLYVHTQEALWNMPKNYQERVTDEIVSFIGTGSYFEIPPQKIVDDSTGNSAGTFHKWGTIKTPYGVFFISEREGKVFHFDGKLNNISNKRMIRWFKNNSRLVFDQEFERTQGVKYEFSDNPSNMLGTGFISTYDPVKERVIFTKRDYLNTPAFSEYEDMRVCSDGTNLIGFPDYTATVNNMLQRGFEVDGNTDDCRLRFRKTNITTTTRTFDELVDIPNNTEIIVLYDVSGSFNPEDQQVFRDAFSLWETQYRANNPAWTGGVYSFESASERWLDMTVQAIQQRFSGETLQDKNVLVVSLVNEAESVYLPEGALLSSFVSDRDAFLAYIPQLESFSGISYPVVSPIDTTFGVNTVEFLRHSIRAIFGTPLTQTQIDGLQENSFVQPWSGFTNTLTQPNIYPDGGLLTSGWSVITDVNTGFTRQELITKLNTDLTNFLLGTQETITREETTISESFEFEFVEGVEIEPLDSFNWTISYSLKEQAWISWHSYVPNMYISTKENFYSYMNGISEIWEHNVKGAYQTFYGNLFPHIIEFVDNPDVLDTKTWEDISVQTQAKRYNSETDSFVEDRYAFFNKLLAYNTRQCTGVMDLVVKELQDNANFFLTSVQDISNVSKTEKDWYINNLRDIRTRYDLPIFIENIDTLKDEPHWIDKIVNTSSLNEEKNWRDLEPMRDKYLVVRLIFDTFADVKLITNFAIIKNNKSEH